MIASVYSILECFNMIILGIESSCDDTSVALLDCSDDGFFVLSEKTASQIDVHKKYGGVVPEIAGRMHAENILPVVEEVVSHYQLTINNKQFKPDVIAVTTGPGLITGLLVGAEVAKTLSYLWDIPLIPTNHIEGHIHSVLVNGTDTKSEVRSLKSIAFPALCLIVSGGHTELVLMKDFGEYELLGKTRDDAAGEAFDKVGKLLGFEYPGGPKISAHAKTGNPHAIPFPRPMMTSDGYDFSFAGLKTAALYWLRDNNLAVTDPNPIFASLRGKFGISHRPITISDFCASFEEAIVDVLIQKTKRAAKEYHAKTIILGGGVSANPKLRNSLQNLVEQNPSYELLVPSPKYTMDNGAMIAVASYHRAKNKKFVDWKDVVVNPNWKVYDL